MASKKGGGSTRNGRDSEAKRLGVKVFGGQSINAGGIINVSYEYLCRREGKPCDINDVNDRIGQIPGRLREIWQASDSSGNPSNEVADSMAQKLIGR